MRFPFWLMFSVYMKAFAPKPMGKTNHTHTDHPLLRVRDQLVNCRLTLFFSRRTPSTRFTDGALPMAVRDMVFTALMA